MRNVYWDDILAGNVLLSYGAMWKRFYFLLGGLTMDIFVGCSSFCLRFIESNNVHQGDDPMTKRNNIL